MLNWKELDFVLRFVHLYFLTNGVFLSIFVTLNDIGWPLEELIKMAKSDSCSL